MFFKKKKRKVINIEGMTSEECAKKIEITLNNLIDTTNVKVKLAKKQAIITYDNTLDEILIQETIEKLGYTVTGIKDLS